MLIYDYVDPAVLTADVREEPEPATYGLNAFLPDRERVDVKASWTEVTQTNRAATFRSWDAETPIGKRDQASRKSIQLPPLGEKYVLDEYERLELDRLRGANTDEIVEAVYNDARRGARAIRARMELARGDVLTDGKFTLAGENGLVLEVDYGVPAGNLVNPAGADWDDHATSVPVTDLLTWLEAYVDITGGLPAAIVTSRSVVGDLLMNEEIRTMSRGGVGTIAPSSVSRSDLNALFDGRDIPPIVTYDARVDVDGVTTRVIPANKVIFVPPGDELGSTDWGVTVEGLGLVKDARIQLSEAPGIVAVNLEQGDPARLWTKATAVGMPILRNPKRLFVATVK